MGKTVELIESKGKSIRSAKVLIGKTQNEVENKVEINEPTKTRGKAVVIADLKRKFLNIGRGSVEKVTCHYILKVKYHVITLSLFVLIFPFYNSL